MEFLQEYESVWERLKRETRPIVLYGMGDGAEKILNAFELYGIQAAGVFASDEFVRGHHFRGFPVERLRDLTARLGEDIVVAISFASQRPEVLALMDAVDAQYDTVAPDVPVVGGTLFTPEFVKENAQRLRQAYALLADAQSRRVFECTVAYKLTGRLRYLRDCTSAKDEVFQHLLQPRVDEHFADLGAYNGDTIRELLGYTEGCFASITALEPDHRNFKKLGKYVEERLTGAVRLIQAGAWDRDETQSFAGRAGRNSAVSTQGTPVQMRALDSVLAGAPCTLLKLDVEGAERRALLGAQETIRTFRPRINLAAYHRSEDLFELPLLVHSLCAEYRIYMRHHPYVPAWDTNIYAVAD